MPKDFMPPDFSKSDIELRYENDVVSIYGTAKGLKLLADICLNLVGHPSQGHVHLDKSHGLPLTPESKNGAVAIFERESADTRRGWRWPWRTGRSERLKWTKWTQWT